MLAAAAAAASAAAATAAAAAAAAVSTVYRPAQHAPGNAPGRADSGKRKLDGALVFRPVCPAEMDIRELRKRLKPHAPRPADPLLSRTPSERFPVWSEDGPSASSVVCSSSSSHLGNGSFGSVEPVTSVNMPGQKLALKLISKQSVADSSANRLKEVLSDAARELKLLQQNDSFFLMSAIGGGGVLLQDLQDDTLATTDCPEEHVGIAILMEEMTGDLHDRILEHGALPEDQCQFYVASVLLGLEALHDRRILHRDIKAENILIGSNGYAKIADFGLSKTSEETVESPRFHGVCGTSEYFAPEIACLTEEEASMGTQYSMAVDLWAAGVLAYYLLEGFLPFEALSESDPEDEVDRQILAFCDKTNPLSWTNSTPAARDFVAKLLQQDPMDRLGMASTGGYAALRKHPWFEGFDWKALMSGKMEAPWIPEPLSTGAAKPSAPHQPEE